MSENNLKVEGNEIHYIYGDQEYTVGQEIAGGATELGNVSWVADAPRTILVDGQYILTESPAILLQEGDNNLTQYYINDNSEGLIVDSEENSVDLFEATEIVQFVEDDATDGQQIVYYTNDDTNSGEFITPVQEFTEESIEGIQGEDGNIYPFKRIKLEAQLLNFDEFIQQQGEGDGEGSQNQKEESVEYTIMEEENQSDFQTAQNSNNAENQEESSVDLSKITGRNLITGQTVTLHSYMEKLKKRLNRQSGNVERKSPKKLTNDYIISDKNEEKNSSEFSDLIDKKISIGKTKSGKRIIAKIIHVEKKKETVQQQQQQQQQRESEEEEEEQEEESGDFDQTKIVVKKSTVSKESFEQISKTLGGVMEMESVRKKLENKNIVVKLIEKKYVSESDSFVKSVSYSYGYMEQIINSSENEIVEKWHFVQDQETQDALLGNHFNNNEEGHEITNSSEKKLTKFPITTSLTILIIHEKKGFKTIRVNLNPAPGNLCTICAQYFKTNLQLRQHMNQAHNTFASNTTTTCEVCEQTFDDFQQFQKDRNLHIQEGKLFLCNKCSKGFTTQNKLQKHYSSHYPNLKPLECSVCKVRWSSEATLKKHLLTHTGLKPFMCVVCGEQFQSLHSLTFHKKIHFPENHYACSICMRTFSRYSNLLRHQEIHKGNGALYKCDICFCSYNYVSSLTRHMVQNHLDEFRKRQKNNVGDSV